MEQLLLIAHRFFLNLLEQMMGIGEPRRKNCPLDNFLFLLFDSHYIKTLIFILEQMMGIAEPRRENCPPDNFLFLLFDSHYIKTLIFYSGADDGNRTHTIALGRQSSTTKLHLHYFLSIL